MRQGGCWCAGQAVKTSGWRARECTGSQATIGRERCWRQAGIPPASASVSKPLPTAKAPTFHPAFCRSNRRLACRVGERALCLVLPVAPSAVALPFVLLYAILRPTRFACAVAGRLPGQTCLRLQGARAADKESHSAWRASVQQHGVSCDTSRRRAPGVNDSRRSDNPALAFADEWRRVDLQGVALRSAETLPPHHHLVIFTCM